MKFFYHGKDGGEESNVEGFWLCEIKSLFSIALLKFSDGSREAFHNHAFNSISWVLKGKLKERRMSSFNSRLPVVRMYFPSFIPVVTTRKNMHQVFSYGTTWVLTFRGPWSKQWKEYLPKEDKYVTLESGRKVVDKAN